MIRNLILGDYEAYSALRSLGLKTDPSSFWASEQEEIHNRINRFEDTVSSDHDFIKGMFVNDQLVSCLGFKREEKIKLNHKGLIWGVYTREDHRGNGHGRNLLKASMKQAFQFPGITQINLSVGSHNHAAIRLYENMGFMAYGEEKNACHIGDQYYDELFMVIFKDSFYLKK